MSTVLAVPDDVRAKVEGARHELAANSGRLQFVEVTHEKDSWWMPKASGCGSTLIAVDHRVGDVEFGWSGTACVILWRRVA